MIRLIPIKMMVAIILSRMYLSAFNVWVSFAIQETLNISLGLSTKELNYFKFLAILLILSSLLYGVIFFYNQMKVEEVRIMISEKVGNQIMSNVFKNKFDLKPQDIESGRIINVFTNDMTIVSNYFTKGILPLVEMILTILFGVIYISIFSWQFSLIYIVVGLIFYFINNNHNKKLTKYNDEYLIEDDVQKNFVNELFNSAIIFSIYNLNKWMQDKHTRIFNRRKKTYSKYANMLSKNRALMTVLINLVQLVLLVIGFYLVSRGHLLMGTMIGLWNAGAGSVLFSFSDIPNIISYLSKHKSSLSRVNKIIEHDNLVKENETITILKGSPKIVIKNISFNYGNKKIFENFSLDIDSKGMTFIIGKSGTGKTTLFYLLFGIIKPKIGNIYLYSEEDIEDEHTIAYVPSNNGIFNISLYENVTLLSDIKRTQEEIRGVFNEIGLEKYVDDLDKIPGEGIELSLGEKKRISIIRALLSDRKYLFLDEPFSDIDKNNQKLVINLLRRYSKNKSVIVITHTSDYIEVKEKVIDLDRREETYV